jgi:formamidopyrimidine-DNA glycosylase
MPELPEVETVVRALRPSVVGQRINRVNFPTPSKSLTNMAQDSLALALTGCTISAIDRRAKYMLFSVPTHVQPFQTLMIHLKMTGHLYLVAAGGTHPQDRWLRAEFLFGSGQAMRFADPRRFGRVYLANNPVDLLPELGPEPIDPAFTLPDLVGRLAGRKAPLKALLLDQSFVSGIGNIYADEALHIAGLHPLRPANSLTEAEAAALFAAMRQALEDGIRHEGASIGSYRKPDGSRGASQNHFRAYRTRENADLPCPVCAGPISTIRVAGRGTHFCPTCQPPPKSDTNKGKRNKKSNS